MVVDGSVVDSRGLFCGFVIHGWGCGGCFVVDLRVARWWLWLFCGGFKGDGVVVVVGCGWFWGWIWEGRLGGQAVVTDVFVVEDSG